MWQQLRQALYQHYATRKLNTGWVSNTNFEPSVADSIFKAWAAAIPNLTVKYQWQFIRVIKKDNRVIGAVFEAANKKQYAILSKIVIDATELGDVLKASGAAYNLGMDDPLKTGEAEARQQNNIIQDLTWAAILKDYGPGADKTIEKPAGYNETLYYCCCTDAPCSETSWNGDKQKMLNYGKLPRSKGATQDKYMLNWPPHGNDIYLNVVEASTEERNIAYEKAKQHTLGFIYFIQTRLGMKHIGLADDELNNGMALIPYNREGRRVKGLVQLTTNHLKNLYNYNLYKTGIAVGDYPIDHHHARYPGKVPEIEFPAVPAFNIPMGCVIPAQIQGLLVCDKNISVTNIVNGSTRLQPVVLLTGQAVGVLAALCVQQNIPPAKLPIRKLQQALLNEQVFILPFSDVSPHETHWQAVQKMAATGILQGHGKAQGWANKMYFYPDSLINMQTLAKGLHQFEKRFPLSKYNSINWLTAAQAWQMIEEMHHLYRQRLQIPHKYPSVVHDEYKKILGNAGFSFNSNSRFITRKEVAVLLNSLAANPFNKPVSINGDF
ncbi:MAG: FAD-dependent oxidoreductase [Flavihumibacter sp.]|nr:FAD-dependent oxidoreductase [Flavihumibacter sp.]